MSYMERYWIANAQDLTIYAREEVTDISKEVT